MGRISWIRRLSLYATTATMAGFGLTGIASAQTITNTGPHSTNRIDTKIDNKCTVKNDNDVNVKNSNDQKATTGDATVGGSGHSSSDGWSGSDPADIQASSSDGGDGSFNATPASDTTPSVDPLTQQTNDPGHDSLFGDPSSFLDGATSDWHKDPGRGGNFGGNTFGGDATTGDATNHNSTDISVDIDNSVDNPCIQNNVVLQRPSKALRVAKSNVFNKAAVRVAPNVSGAPGIGGGRGGVGGVGGFGAGPSISKQVSPAVSAEVVTPGRGAGPAVVAVQKNVISNTGPESSNKISTTVNNNVTVKNDNNIHVTNTNDQKASTGDATVSGNTSAGSGDTGGAGNGNGTAVGADVSN